MSFSVVILTYNEEANLPACLDSVRGVADVVVLDSFSTDRTVEIARASGARVVQRPFDDFAGQRNYALDQIPFESAWLFHLDADERMTPDLRAECAAAVVANQHSGYYVPSKLMFQGKWLKYSGMYPTYQMRFLKLGEIRFEQVGHGQREAMPTRSIGKMTEPYLHHNFSKGLDDWFAKHNRYSTAEANEALASDESGWAGIFSTDGLKRRRALKRLSFQLPMRPTLRFLYMYVLRGGFLDGSAGLTYCRLVSTYEWMVTLKMWEFKRRRRGLGI